MGGNQSQGRSMRASRFQHPVARDPVYVDTITKVQAEEEEHHINISNKMVERLVEDAAMSGGGGARGAETPQPSVDWMEHMYIKKLEDMDEQHSEKYGLNVKDVAALARRVEMRMDKPDERPLCVEQYEKLYNCYNNADTRNAFRCFEIVEAFSRCVREANVERLHATADETQARAERERQFTHVAHSSSLRDRSPPRVSVL